MRQFPNYEELRKNEDIVKALNHIIDQKNLNVAEITTESSGEKFAEVIKEIEKKKGSIQ